MGALGVNMTMKDVLELFLGDDLPIRVEAYDGTVLGNRDSTTIVRINGPQALHRLVTGRGRELSFARSYVAGDVDIVGDIYEVVGLRDKLSMPRLSVDAARTIMAALGIDSAKGLAALRPLPPPPEEIRLRGVRHSRRRDSAAIASHYDVSNEFYRLFLGPTMTYSCALFETPQTSLDAAQLAKIDLICRKLGARPGHRLLDVGCGWASLAIHAARHYGVDAVGITISEQQAELARKRVAEAGLSDKVDVRLCDYRDVHDGPFDLVSSVGMFEHVGLRRLQDYFAQMHRLLRPGGRFLNHAISRPAGARSARIRHDGFVNRYVFPDGELHEVGSVISAMQEAGFEARHMESLREHYALTLRAWVARLEQRWTDAVDETSEARSRIWRMYMAGSALLFEANELQVQQVLATHTAGGEAGVGLRPDW